MTESITRECKPLLDACTVRLYQDNAFRVTGLAVDATARLIKRKVNDLKLAAEMDDLEAEYTHAFKPDPTPSLNQIRAAGQRLQDLQLRFVDEFFWFWPLDWKAVATDQALTFISNGDMQQAEDIWKKTIEQSSHQTEGLAAKHNLAVMYHLKALEQEHSGIEQNGSHAPERLADIDGCWQASFDYWEELVDHEPFWSMLSDRVRVIDDPSLTTGFVKRFRSTFPIAFDNVNASLATLYATRGHHDRASIHIQYMEQTHQGLDDTTKTMQDAAAPLHTRIDHAIQHALNNLRDDPKSGLERASLLIESTKEPLATLSALLEPGGSEISDTCDEIADAHHSCLIAYGNETEDWPNCIMALETSCKQLARGAAIIARIESSLEAARSNYEQKQLKEICWFCKKNKGDNDFPVIIPMYGNVKRESASPLGIDGLISRMNSLDPYFGDLLGQRGGKITWQHVKVEVPRCAACEKIHHSTNSSRAWIPFVSTVVGLISWLVVYPSATALPLWGGLIGLIIGLLGWWIISNKFPAPVTADLSTRYKFPEILELTAQGWKYGSSPPEANR